MDSISQNSLHDELLSRLRKMITGGHLRPGEKIPERQLCDQFGVSRTPLREALKVLAAEGLIELAPNRGAMIAAIQSSEWEEWVPISEAIEALSGELACQHITDTEIDEIKRLHAGMIADYEAGNLKGYLDKNRQIHQRIVSGAHNPLLETIYDTLFFRIGRSQLKPNLPREAVARDLACHKEILEALEKREGAKLAELLKRHLQAFLRLYESQAF